MNFSTQNINQPNAIIMQPILLLKILLAIGCLYLSYSIMSHESSIVNATYELSSINLKNDPAKDSSENRKNYARKRLEINNKIASLNAKRWPAWYGYIAVILIPIGGGLIGNIIKTLKKRRG
jgi:hypothetical protein